VHHCGHPPRGLAETASPRPQKIIGKANTSFTPDFCNKIGPKQPIQNLRFMSPLRGWSGLVLLVLSSSGYDPSGHHVLERHEAGALLNVTALDIRFLPRQHYFARQSFPCRVYMRTRPASRRTIRKPSCLISCSQPGPAGGVTPPVGRHGSINTAGLRIPVRNILRNVVSDLKAKRSRGCGCPCTARHPFG
jgi:hypothetical protein